MGVLNELLRIKEFREDKAEREVVRARRALEEAVIALEKSCEALVEYCAECERRERALYADLYSRLVRLTELDRLALEIDTMQQGAQRYREDVKSAEIVKTASVERLDSAKECHRQAMRAREKFSELIAAAVLDDDIERERMEDGEMEEVGIARLRGRNDAATDELSLERAA